MPPRRISQRLSCPGGEALPQTSTQNHLPTQNLSTIAEGLKHTAFDDVPEVEVQHPANNTFTTSPGLNHNFGGVSSTQTNGGIPHQSTP
jgi:hypothetical protein